MVYRYQNFRGAFFLKFGGSTFLRNSFARLTVYTFFPECQNITFSIILQTTSNYLDWLFLSDILYRLLYDLAPFVHCISLFTFFIIMRALLLQISRVFYIPLILSLSVVRFYLPPILSPYRHVFHDISSFLSLACEIRNTILADSRGQVRGICEILG